MKKIIFVTAFIIVACASLGYAQTKPVQQFKFNIVKNDTMNFSDLNPRMELVAADKSLEIISYDLVFFSFDNNYKFTMNGSKLAESIINEIKKVNPKPKRISIENIVAYSESDGKEKTYKGFTLHLK